ncbi:MFS general substrate transporter [Ceraceosorus guamensis]|uniref:MFS general substrate transporter n=1 Tax=Ceraceosorus guamensis TaxID=1522189 RepID=A0A316W527_9BASI|nr:MFS general substrate transporter [Ceraceosorus guamensis]PWN43781.1 MFS general substrate transporter [Ceraceosorus guamensis]
MTDAHASGHHLEHDVLTPGEADEKVKGLHGDARVSDSNILTDDAALPAGTLDPVYEAKARVLNRAIQEIGMGRYQWQLFVVVGFGWASDNLWPIVTSLIFTPISNEFNPDRPPLLTLAQNIGLLVGAVFWGFGADIFGRRWAFNLTIGITGLFGMIAGSAPNFAAIGVFAALWSVGVGGNLPVDSAIFLEFLPATHQYLLTILSVDWALAQLLANLIAWPLLGNLTCPQTAAVCARQDNMGWRYFIITMGGIAVLMFVVRFVFFSIYESPKYLMSRGRDAEAVRVVHEVARRNGKVSNLTLEDLSRFDDDIAGDKSEKEREEALAANYSTKQAILRSLKDVDSSLIKSLFATRKMAISTSMIIVIWALLGLSFPLYNAYVPFIQASRGADFGDGSTYLTYRNSLIIAVVGIPGCIVGALLSELPRIGRKGTLFLSTAGTGAFLFASTTATNSPSLLGWQCAYSFSSSAMYAILYAYTPEVFPTRVRGTGNAITASANRIFGIMAPIVAMFANLETSAPVYVSGALFIAAGILALVLPFESRGKASL